MNAAQRKELEKAATLIGEAEGIVRAAAQDARDTFDSMSEKAQQSEKGERAEAIADMLDELAETLLEADSTISSAKGNPA